MLRTLRNPTFRHLFAAQIVALLGTGLATVALGLLAWQLAGGNAGAVLGTALAIKMWPMLRWPRWRLPWPNACRAGPFWWRWT